MVKSKALEINVASYRVEVTIDPKYLVLQQVLSRYFGLQEGLNTFLKELSHPYKNWHFIVREARPYSLNYFHLLQSHPQGPEAARRFVAIFTEAIETVDNPEVKTDAVDNLLLFLQKIIKEGGTRREAFLPVLNGAFERVHGYGDEHFFLFLKSFYQIKKLAGLFLRHGAGAADDFSSINRLLAKYYRHNYDYWMRQPDPQRWLAKEGGPGTDGDNLRPVFEGISHEAVGHSRSRLNLLGEAPQPEAATVLAQLLELPGFGEIVEKFRVAPQRLFEIGEATGQGYLWKLVFNFYILNVPGLSAIHEDSLRDVNRTLGWLISHEDPRTVQTLLRKTFSILKARSASYPATALNCVLNMGQGVYQTDDHDLVNFFIDAVIDLGFQAPMIGGVDDDWQTRANKAHLLNIRIWLELIELNPKWSTRLLSALTIHLALGGVFIKDTDIFPRDLTRLLNAGIGPVYNLVKQLTRLLPAFFNDIGAEGKLRDLSTRIDEITHRRDPLIHFLRKQSHVESSNRIIGFMEAVLVFWQTGNKHNLQPFVPPNIYAELTAQGPYFDGVHQVMSHLHAQGVRMPSGLLSLSEADVHQLLETCAGGSAADRERVELAIGLYKLLQQKYHLDFIEMDHYISLLETEVFPDVKQLRDALAEPDLNKRLPLLFDYLEQLKALIVSDQTFETREDIYKKRHFTVDIPSTYGSYHETKFDALGFTFRLESLVNVLCEELVDQIDLSLITKATFYQIYDRIKLFDTALRLDGIFSAEMERQLDFLARSLEVRGFTFTQYLDVIKGFAVAVKHIINDHFNNPHEQNLNRILSQVPLDQLLPKYLPRETQVETDRLRHRVSEIFFRERIAHSLGLQQLDLFLSRILSTLYQQADNIAKDKLHILLNYDPQRAIAPISEANHHAASIIHLGNKGFNLVKLKSYGLPIPPGFIITTEVFRCREIVEGYPPAADNFREQILKQIRELERETGKAFGDPVNPLLLSVRSGSSISQPGMMDTFLDVGMNEEITAGMAARTGNSWFAWDNYRRFLQCYGMSYDLERDDFDAVINEFKRRLGIPFKKWFTGEQMREVALAYKDLIVSSAIEIEPSSFEQLLLIIRKVMDSWHSAKARTYRKIMGISDDWGTAVTIQNMVFGNRSELSGSGVFFTHDPRWSGDFLRLWGDFSIENQGEDVVSGLVQTLPISKKQRDFEKRETDIILETHFPEIYQTLLKWAGELINTRGWSPQEMEFTFESPSMHDLYLLQTRDMSIREHKQVPAFDLEGVSDEQFLGHGIGVSGGAMSGRVVFSLEEIDDRRAREPDTPLILVRGDTVPDDIREIFAADGLLTARGGLTSHAAVVAHRLGKTCVVGCGDLLCNEREKSCFISQVHLKAGDFISIDGQEGSVYHGRIKILEQ